MVISLDGIPDSTIDSIFDLTKVKFPGCKEWGKIRRFGGRNLQKYELRLPSMKFSEGQFEQKLLQVEDMDKKVQFFFGVKGVNGVRSCWSLRPACPRMWL